MKRYDAAIIGGGFKGMMTAYGLSRKGQKVCIIDQGKILGGFMAPMQWNGVDIDKGPQYLDGINESHKTILDDIMQGFEPLTALNFSYASFWNDSYTPDFSIPDYRSLPLQEKATILFETITAGQLKADVATIKDMFCEANEHSYQHIRRWCNKFLQNDTDVLSPVNRSFVTFFSRKLLLDNALSLELKKLPLLDDILAANKKTIDHGTYNLYPLGRNLGYFRTAFEARLAHMGVDSFLECSVTGVETNAGIHHIRMDGQDDIEADAVYCAATIESSESLLLGTQKIKQYISPVAQIFYLLEVSIDQELPFYIMDYADHSLARLTHFTAYGNHSQSSKDTAILCAEIPTRIGSECWEQPEQQLEQLLQEIAEMGVEIKQVHASQPFKIPSTYRAVLAGYEDALTTIKNAIAQQHGDSVHILTPHLLTRASVMHDLEAHGIL